jgi:peroxiredoxin
MTVVEIGQPAPGLRLPAGAGGEVGLEDYRGRRGVVVWFTKGMACAFCRTQMSQLARAYPRLHAAGAEVLQVTPTKIDRARFYARNFPIPFPYLCDPDYAAHRAWGIDVRSHSPIWYAQQLVTVARAPAPPPAEIGNPRMTFAEAPALLHDSDMGVFVVDRDGVVRYRRSAAYATEHGVTDLPAADEVLRVLAAA